MAVKTEKSLPYKVMDKVKQIRKYLLLAVKIAVGSSAAIYTAQRLDLEYAVSAGTIALLTLLMTKWETVKVSVFRIVTFFITIVASEMIFLHIEQIWIAYGLLIFIVVFISELFDWRVTISVNSVVGAHLLVSGDFSFRSVRNELLLVLIGITAALILNLIHDYRGNKKDIIINMRYTENQLQMVVGGLAAYLAGKEMQFSIWDKICDLEKRLQGFIKDAYEYQSNTFVSHPGYYIDYFEMRQNQCHVLHNLHYEMKKIRSMPSQAKVISDYMLYLTDYVIEKNTPTEQREKLEEIFQHMKKEDLPVTRDEFESRALLYHILMDLEEFLVFKQRFVNGLNERQKKEYWNR